MNPLKGIANLVFEGGVWEKRITNSKQPRMSLFEINVMIHD